MGDTPATVTEIVRRLAGQGFDADFPIAGGRAGCGGCGELLLASEIVVDAFYRFEGPSDPGDEMIVAAVTCGRCGRRGTIACGYGPSTSPEEAEFLLALPRESG